MLYTVEVRLIGGEFMTSMAEMRTWLNHRRIEPDAFRHSPGGAGVTFRVDFKIESEATEFARAFGGRLIGLPLPSPNKAALWPSSRAEQPALASSELAAPVVPKSRRRA